MSLSWKVLPSWLFQLERLRLKDDRIYTAKDKHFSSDISCRNYKFCTAVLYFDRKALSSLGSSCSLPHLAQLPELKPRPSTPAPGSQGCDSRAGCFTAQEEAHGRSGHSNPYQPRVGFTAPGKQKSWKLSCHPTWNLQLLILGNPMAPFLQGNLDKTGRNRRKSGQMKIAWAL